MLVSVCVCVRARVCLHMCVVLCARLCMHQGEPPTGTAIAGPRIAASVPRSSVVSITSASAAAVGHAHGWWLWSLHQSCVLHTNMQRCTDTKCAHVHTSSLTRAGRLLEYCSLAYCTHCVAPQGTPCTMTHPVPKHQAPPHALLQLHGSLPMAPHGTRACTPVP